MGEIKERFFKDSTKGIITIISLGLMFLFVVFIGPEITGSTVFIHPEEITLNAEDCKFVFHKEICLVKTFYSSTQKTQADLAAYLTVDKSGGQTTTASSSVQTINFGKSKLINDLTIKVKSIDPIENSVTLEIVPYNFPQIQKTGLEDLWYPFIKNQKPNLIIVSDNEEATKKVKELLKPELGAYTFLDSYAPGEIPDKYKSTNQIVVGLVSSNTLVREYLVGLGYEPNTLLAFDQGYLNLISDPTKQFNLQGKNVGPQAILIITGESEKGLQKAINALQNKQALVGNSVQI